MYAIVHKRLPTSYSLYESEEGEICFYSNQTRALAQVNILSHLKEPKVIEVSMTAEIMNFNTILHVKEE